MFENEGKLIRPQSAGYMEWPVYPEQRLPGAHIMLGYQPKAANTSSSSSGASAIFRMNENQDAVENSPGKAVWGPHFEDVNTLIDPSPAPFSQSGYLKSVYRDMAKIKYERVTIRIVMETAKNGDRKLVCTLKYRDNNNTLHGEVYYTELRTMDGWYLYLHKEDYKKLKNMTFEELFAYWAEKNLTPKFSSCGTYVYPIDLDKAKSASKEMEHGYEAADLMAPKDTDVYAFFDGKVISGGEKDDYGETRVVVFGDNQYIYLYDHLKYGSVPTEGRVKAGKVIGKVGPSGMNTSPHLHFDITKSTALGGMYNYRAAMSRKIAAADRNHPYLKSFVSPQKVFKEKWGEIFPKPKELT